MFLNWYSALHALKPLLDHEHDDAGSETTVISSYSCMWLLFMRVLDKRRSRKGTKSRKSRKRRSRTPRRSIGGTSLFSDTGTTEAAATDGTTTTTSTMTTKSTLTSTGTCIVGGKDPNRPAANVVVTIVNEKDKDDKDDCTIA